MTEASDEPAQALGDDVERKANQLLDRFDDPGEALDYAYQQLAEQVGAVQQAGHRLALAENQLVVERSRIDACADSLASRAREAVEEGRDDLAREALARRLVLRTGSASLTEERDQIVDEDGRFIDAAKLLERNVQVLFARKDAVKASYSNTGSKVEIETALSQVRGEVADVRALMARVNARLTQLRVQAARIDVLLASGTLLDLATEPDEIKNDLAKVRTSAEVENELARIRGATRPDSN